MPFIIEMLKHKHLLVCNLYIYLVEKLEVFRSMYILLFSFHHHQKMFDCVMIIFSMENNVLT